MLHRFALRFCRGLITLGSLLLLVCGYTVSIVGLLAWSLGAPVGQTMTVVCVLGTLTLHCARGLWPFVEAPRRRGRGW